MNIIWQNGYILLAQANLDSPMRSFRDFLAKVGLLVGVCLIIAGGVKIGRGETEAGLVSAVGGLLIALAVPIMTWLASLVGIQF